MAGYISGGVAIDYADGIGEKMINGQLWRWHFHEYTGPSFYIVKRGGREVDQNPSPGWSKNTLVRSNEDQCWIGSPLRYWNLGGRKERKKHKAWCHFETWYRRYYLPRSKNKRSWEIIQKESL